MHVGKMPKNDPYQITAKGRWEHLRIVAVDIAFRLSGLLTYKFFESRIIHRSFDSATKEEAKVLWNYLITEGFIHPSRGKKT